MSKCRLFPRFSFVVFVPVTICLLGCRTILITIDPILPVQGDTVTLTIDASEHENLRSLIYTVNGQSRTVTQVPVTVTVQTCKYSLGQYLDKITVSVKADYRDGQTVSSGESSWDLTVCDASRKGPLDAFGVMVQQGQSGDTAMALDDMKNALIDELDSLPGYQWSAADPAFFTGLPGRADNWPLYVFMGHGNSHLYDTGVGLVDISSHGFGGGAHCGAIGRSRYLAFCSCLVLSMDFDGYKPWQWYWRHEEETALDPRPFSGLHEVSGFRTDFVFSSGSFLWWSWDNADDFMAAFANNLDAGMRYVDAWQEAVGDVLDMGPGKNLGAVFYLRCYENDGITAVQNDYLFKNANYDLNCDYWEVVD